MNKVQHLALNIKNKWVYKKNPGYKQSYRYKKETGLVSQPLNFNISLF